MNQEQQNQPQATAKDVNIAEHNRTVMTPFVSQFTDNLYKALDKAAERGVVLKEGISPETAEQIISQVLFSIQADYQGDVYQDRNIFESTAFMLGTVVGYPVEMVSTVMRKLPFAAHFSAGMGNGRVKANTHLVALYSKINDIGDKMQDYLPKAESKGVETTVPTHGALNPAMAGA